MSEKLAHSGQHTQQHDTGLLDENQDENACLLNNLKEQLPADEFYKLFTKSLKISTRNQSLIAKTTAQTAQEEEVILADGVLTTEIIEEVMDRELEKSRKRHKRKPSFEAKRYTIKITGTKLDKNSCFIWFIARKSDMKNVVPDVELIKYKQVCLDMIARLNTCAEAHFGISKLLANESKFECALQHLKISVKEQPNDKIYKLWYGVMMVISVESKPAAIEAKNICYSKP